MKVTFNMATIPDRLDIACKAVESVYDQADEVRVYLNNFKEIPKEFIDDKIKTYRGKDLNASGKLYNALNKDEYYFCIDDDLEYPNDYKDYMISKLNKYDDNIAVSLHGKVLRDGYKRNYFSSNTIRKSFHCLQDVHRDSWVHVLGNGVSAFNTNKVKIDVKKFKYFFMDDIYVSLQMQQQQIPILVLKHNKNYLRYNHPKVKTLHEIYVQQDTAHKEIINSIKLEVW